MIKRERVRGRERGWGVRDIEKKKRRQRKR